MKKKSFLKILKLVGLGMAGVFGFLGIAVGVFALFGGFNEKIVKMEGMAFEQSAYVLDGNIHNEEGIFDDSIKLLPTNEDANRLDVSLTGGSNIVVLPTGDNSRAKGNLNIKLVTITEGVSPNSYTYNKGGEFELIATQDDTLLTTKTKVFVESKVNNFTLTDNLNGSLIYPGSKFRVNNSNVLPANSFDKPVGLEFYSVYGQDYFKKTFLYFSSNESVASVDMYTGEVEVLTEGDFTIFAYVPTTYKNNSLLPVREQCASDSEFFALLEANRNGLPFTIKSEISYTSNPISVSGISASTNVFDLYVNETYKYSIEGQGNEQDKQINLNVNLQAPANSNFTSEQLSYKLQDLEIFEGYKNNDKFYISANQSYNEDGVLESTYFDIAQNKKPLYFTITPRDYTYSKDLYLVIRIANEKLDLTSIKANDLLANDTPVEESEDYVYYAFVKINTKIVENSGLTLSEDKIMASFTKTGESDYLYISADTLLNLGDLLQSILPENATYKDVRFFVRNNGTIDEPIIVTNANGEIELCKIHEGTENEQNGYFVKAQNEGTLQFYASVVKTDRNGENVVKLFNSNDITLIVTQEINLYNFNVSFSGKDSFNLATNKYEITKGNQLTITFETDNIDGLKKAYNEGFFNVTSTTNERIAATIDIDNKTIILTAINEGETIVNIEFNGNNLSFNEPLIPLNIVITNSDLKSINLISSDGAIDAENKITFQVFNDSESTSDSLLFAVKNTTLTNITSASDTRPNALELSIELNGGNDNTELYCYSNNNTDVELNIEDKTLKIHPNKVCENVQFYLYSMVGGNMVKSSTYTINIVADYTITANRINEITINSNLFEKVIGGESFELFGENGFLSILTSDGNKFNNNLFTINSLDLFEGNKIYTNSGFINVNSSKTCVISVYPKFSNEIYNYNFYVIPKYVVTAETLEITTGESVTSAELIEKISLICQSYAKEEDLNLVYPTHKGQIFTSFININASDIKFYSDDEFTNEITNYVASSYAFDNSQDTIYLSVGYDANQDGVIDNSTEKFVGQINVVINSNLELQNSITYLNNGEEILLSNLFKITSGGNVIVPDDNKLNVVFDENTFNKLKDSGITFYDISSNEINSYFESFEEFNNPLTQTKSYISKLNKLYIPNEFNTLTLTNLNAYVSCEIGGNFTVSENHEFLLDFQISNIVLNNTNIINNTIYLLDNINNKTEYIKQNFIESATVINKTTNSPSDAISSVTVEIITNDGAHEVNLSLNNYKIILNVITVDEFITQNNDTKYFGKAYLLSDLINLSDEIKDLDNIWSYVNISKILKDGITEATSVDYSIENGCLIIKKEGYYKITFEILGNQQTFDYTFNGIEILLDNDPYKVYSNLNYDLFEEETINKLENSNLNYSIEILNVDNTILENANIVIDNNKQLKIGNYTGSTFNFKLKFTFNTTGYTGVTKEVNIQLNSLFITTNFNEIYEGRQVLLNAAYHDLSKYFTINSSDDSIINDNILKYYVNGIELTLDSNKLNYQVNFTNFDSKGLNEFDLIVNLIDGQQIGKIEFSGEYAKLVVTSYPDTYTTPYFNGQTLTRNDLMTLVRIEDYNGDLITKYNDQILFNGYSLNDELEIAIFGSVQIEVKLGEQIGTSTISGGIIDFRCNNTISVYTDTKTSNYITAVYRDKVLTLNYMAKVDDNTYAIEEDQVNKLFYYRDNTTNNLIATLNQENGDLIVENLNNVPYENIYVTAYVVGAETQTKNIPFNIKKVNATIIETEPTIYIGDNTTDLRQYAYFGTRDANATAYEISELIYDRNLGNYSYHFNNALNRYEILKNGSVVAYLEGYNLTITSDLDNMSVKLKGYINISSTTSGYELISLRNNDIEMTITFQKIELSLDASKEEFDNEMYYKIETANHADSTYVISPISNLEVEVTFTSFNFSEAFIGIVNNASFSKQLKLTISDDKKSITLPTQEIITIGEADGKFNIKWDKPLSCYVFFTIIYQIDSYTNTFKIVLIPNEKNKIIFKYDDFETFFITVSSPGIYDLTNGAIFSFSNENLLQVNNLSFKYLGENNEEITSSKILEDNYTTNLIHKQNNSSSDYIHEIKFEHTTSLDALSIKSGTQVESNKDYFYCIRLSNDNNFYYYVINVNYLVVEVRNSEDIFDINSVDNRIMISSEAQMDLKKYIYINGENYYDAILTNSNFARDLSFSPFSTNFYSLSTDGIFKPNQTFVGTVNFEFTLYGTVYNVYLQGEDIIINYNYNNSALSEDYYTLQNAKNYYIYITKENDEESLKLNVDLCESINNSISELAGSLTLSNLKYTFGGQEYDNNSELFVITQNNNVIDYKFGGQILARLTKETNYYLLTLSENITGTFEFDLNTQYSSKVEAKTAKVTNEEIIVSYIEPSIKNGQQYQNILSDSTLTLSNFISGVSDKNKLAFSFPFESTYSNISINSGVLTIGEINSEIYIEININYNNLTNKMFVRAIPEYKYYFANSSKQFNVLQNEKIDLTKYAKAWQFIGLDSLNEPIYKQICNYKTNNTNINNYNSFTISNETIITLNNIELTFNVINLSFNNEASYVGETINLKEKLDNIINNSALTFKNVSLEFSESNDFVNTDGIFLASKSGTFNVLVKINDIEYLIIVLISDLSINVNYTNSILVENENTPIKYQNIYATQNLVTDDFISVTSGNFEINKNLQFSLEIISSNGYELTKLNSKIENNIISLFYNDTLLMSIGKDNIICYNTLANEILLKINIFIENNSCVENTFNIRLLPVAITLTSGMQYEINNSNFHNNKLHLLNNFVVANTTADSNNLNLNDKLKFSILTLTDNGQEVYDSTSQVDLQAFLEDSDNKLTITALLGDISNNNYVQANFDLIYTDENSQINTDYNFNRNFENSNALISNGGITAVRSYNNTYITSTKVISGGSFYYDIFDDNGENLIQINSNGTFVIKTNKEITLCIEAFGFGQTITSNVTFATQFTHLTVNYDEITNHIVIENGIRLIEMYSEQSLDITAFLNAGTILDDSLTNVSFVKQDNNGTITIILKSFNVDTLTYGYFDVQFIDSNTNKTFIQRVYVKIYSYQLSKTYIEDYTSLIDTSNFDLKGGLNKNDKFKTIFVAENQSNTGFTINLNDYVKITSENKMNSQIIFTINSIVVAETEGSDKKYKKVESNINDFSELNGNLLTLKSNGTYYIKIKASYDSKDLLLGFRVLNMENNTTETINNITINSVVDLSKLIKITSSNSDGGINGLPYETYDLFDNLELSLSGTLNSYIENGYLFVNEIGTETINYSYNNLNKTISITFVQESNAENLSNIIYIGNKKYLEKDYSNLDIDLDIDITNIENINYNGQDYVAVIETVRDSETNETEKYFIVNNLIKISSKGKVMFYDSANNKFICQNNIGIIYVSVIKDLSYGYKVENYKFNNYIIKGDISSNNYSYQLMGEDKSSYLSYSIIGENGLAISNSVINETDIIVNGITLNTITGEISGTKTDDTIKMYLKVYVQEDNTSLGEKFKLFEI